MPTLTTRAHAKLNLTLDVLGRRSDGYHDLRMVMTSVALSDVITLETGTGDGVRASANLGFLPTGEKNLAASALLRFQEATGRDLGGAHISLEKHIPVCAGMGGGSSDAAAVLRGLNRLCGAGLSPRELEELGAGPEDSVLVGDTKYDVEGAKLCGVPCIGVAYGYAAPGELEQAGAVAIVQDMDELLELLCK